MSGFFFFPEWKRFWWNMLFLPADFKAVSLVSFLVSPAQVHHSHFGSHLTLPCHFSQLYRHQALRAWSCDGLQGGGGGYPGGYCSEERCCSAVPEGWKAGITCPWHSEMCFFYKILNFVSEKANIGQIWLHAHCMPHLLKIVSGVTQTCILFPNSPPTPCTFILSAQALASASNPSLRRSRAKGTQRWLNKTTKNSIYLFCVLYSYVALPNTCSKELTVRHRNNM